MSFAAFSIRGPDGRLRCHTRQQLMRAWALALRIRWAYGWNRSPKVKQRRHSMWTR